MIWQKENIANQVLALLSNTKVPANYLQTPVFVPTRYALKSAESTSCARFSYFRVRGFLLQVRYCPSSTSPLPHVTYPLASLFPSTVVTGAWYAQTTIYIQFAKTSNTLHPYTITDNNIFIMYTRTILSKSYAVARSSTTSTLRPFFLTPIQSRNMASDRKSKSNPKIVETTDTVENTVEGAKQIAEEFGTTLDAMGKSDVGSGSGHGVPGQTGNPVYDAADKVGTMHNKGSDNPSVFSSGGAIGKQFNRKSISTRIFYHVFPRFS